MLWRVLRVLALSVSFYACVGTGLAQTTAFTYQGSLVQSGSPANGNFDFQFQLYDAASGGTVLGTVTAPNLAVDKGLFAATLDFGAQFPGANRWLQISVRPTGNGSYTVLTPRQPLTPAPYALGLEFPLTGSSDLYGPSAALTNTNGPAVTGTNTVRNGNVDPTLAAGLIGKSTATNGVGVSGFADAGSSALGVYGEANQGFGVRGVSTSGNGIYGTSNLGPGVHGANFGSAATNAAGVFGENTFSGGVGVSGIADNGVAIGVYGEANQGFGLRGVSQSGNGIYGTSNLGPGVHGANFGSSATNAPGVLGENTFSGGVGVSGIADNGVAIGVYAEANQGFGLRGVSQTGNGVYGTSNTGPGVHGSSAAGTGYSGAGVLGENFAFGGYGAVGIASGIQGYGVAGIANVDQGIGVYGHSTAGGWAGWFQGDVHIIGNLSKTGGSFKIDHPLDPANKYLSHSFVESPDMKDIYDGVVTTDATGYAVVTLPDWFGALNRDFRYQLTVVDDGFSDDFIQAKIVGGGIHNNRFALRTSAPGVKVSWQVTGTRQDAWANAHRVVVEEDKPEGERGKYLTPEVFGQPPSAGIGYRAFADGAAPAVNPSPAPDSPSR